LPPERCSVGVARAFRALFALTVSAAALLAAASGADAHGIVTHHGDVLRYSAPDPGVGAVVRLTTPKRGLLQIVDRTSPGGFNWGRCLPLTGRKAHCRLKGISRIEIEVFDGNDRVRLAVSKPVLVHAGSGDDRVLGGSGADVLLGEGGNDDLTGGGGADRVSGAEGDDVLRLQDDLPDIGSCGPGSDTVFADEADAFEGLGTLECENLTTRAA
jgi:hypothetical protein